MHKLIDITACPNPLTTERYNALVGPGGSLADIIDKSDIRFPYPIDARITVNGALVPRELWEVLEPMEGDIITLNAIPMGGGGGKDPVKTILTVLLIAGAGSFGAFAAKGLLGANAGAFALGATGILITAGTTYAGMYLLNSLIPPQTQGGDVSTGLSNAQGSQMYSIEHARNRIAPFGAIPQVLGRQRIAALYAATPYTEIVGTDQYLRCLFTFGYGPLNITNLKLGDTDISSYSDVQYVVHENYDASTSDPSVLSIVTQDISEDPVSALIENGTPVTKSVVGADSVSIDLTAPEGIYALAEATGAFSDLVVQMSIQYKLTAGSTWSNPEDSFIAYGADTVSVSQDFGKSTWRSSPADNKRVDLITIDKFDGTLRIHKGVITYPTRGYGEPDTPSVYAAPPGVPWYEWGICYVYSDGSAGVDYITDIRATSGIATYYSSVGDFAPTIGSAWVINIAAGEMKFWTGFHSKQMGLLRQGIIIKLPTTGDYDIRVTRVTAQFPDVAGTQYGQDVYWTNIRTIIDTSPINKNGLALVELRIKATDQLNGAIENFNAVCQSAVTSWDTSSAASGWAEAASSNPADLFRYVLQGTPNKRPASDSEIDLVKLQEWADFCESNIFEYNQIIDNEMSVEVLLRNIAAAGRASLTMIDGKYSVIIDQSQDTPVQHFTPRNTWGFTGSKVYIETPHAFRVRFANEEDDVYHSDEMFVYDDGYDANNATKFEALELPGVTRYQQAWKIGRYDLATLRLRPEMFSFNVDVENLVCNRGDLIRFTHDVPIIGLGSGRITSVTTNSAGQITHVSIDSEVTMEAAKTYNVRFRLDDNTSLASSVVLSVGTVTILELTTPLNTDSADLFPQVDDLWMFGETESESLELIIKEINPAPELNAQIIGVPYHEAIYTSDTGTIPIYSTNISTPSELVPSYDGMASDETVLLFGPTGTPIVRWQIKYAQASNNTLQDVDFIEVQYKLTTPDSIEPGFEENRWVILPRFEKTVQEIFITEVLEGEKYDVRSRYIYRSGITGLWNTVTDYLVSGTTNNPSDVSNFYQTVSESLATLTWTPVTDLDLSHYEIRYNGDRTATDWNGAVVLVEKVSGRSSTAIVSALPGTYFIKAVDFGGRKSDNAATFVSNIQALSWLNVVVSIAENPNYRGIHDNTAVIGGNLKLASAETLADWPLLSDVFALAMGDSDGIASSGYYYFEEQVDLGAVFISKLFASLTAAGEAYANQVGDWPLVGDMSDMLGTATDATWSVATEARSTEGLPNYCLDPLDFSVSGSGWSVGSDSTGTDAVITTDDALGPDNSTLYDKITFGDAVSWVEYDTNSGDKSGETVKVRWRMKAPSAGEVRVSINGTEEDLLVATEWEWYETEAALASGDSGDILFRIEDSGDSNMVSAVWVGDVRITVEGEWTGWDIVELGDYSARGFEFREKLESSQYNVTPSISALGMNVDMPDRVDGADAITSGAGAYAVVFTPAFKDTPALAPVGRNLEQGDYWEITNQSSTGFTITWRDSLGAAVSRVFDWVAKGYGHIQT